jgi:NADPH:quinone reductase-like Zn-dependent oxidoreductase
VTTNAPLVWRLGADHAINYRTSDFVAEVKRLTDGRGVDVVLDMVAGSYIAREIDCLAEDGRWRSSRCRAAQERVQCRVWCCAGA